MYKTANRTKHDAVAEVFVQKIAEAQKNYLVAAGNFHVFVKDNLIHSEWVDPLPARVRRLLGRAIQSMKGDESVWLKCS